MIGYSLPASRNMRRLRAGDVGPDRVGERGGADAEQRRLGAIDADRQLRAGLRRARGARRRCRAPCRAGPWPPARAASTSSRSSPRISSDRRPPPLLPPPERNRFIWLLPPDALARTITPGMPDSWRRRSIAICSLDRVRSSFGFSRSWMLPRFTDAAAAAGAAAGPAEAAAPAGVHDDVASLRAPAALIASSTRVQHRVGDLDARALRQLDVDLDLSLVGLGRELGRQRREDDTAATTTDAALMADHRRPVRQRQVQQPAVAVVHPVEHALADRVEPAAESRCACRPAAAARAASSRAPAPA